jgi:hypothetical protein
MRSLVAIAFVSAACVAPTDDVKLGSTNQAVETNNGEHLNGEHLNGEHLNGEHLNTQKLDQYAVWTSLENVTIDGMPLDYATLNASQFYGERAFFSYGPSDFVGAQFDTMKGDGTIVKYRVDAIVEHDGGATGYMLSYLWNGRWLSVCQSDSGPVEAYPLNGTWDHREGVEGGGSWTDAPQKFTFACRTLGAIAKCVDIGYLPWQNRDHHLACVRMLRADYCRNGTPYTTTGRLINVYDSIGIQVDTDEWPADGEWDAGGARCFTSHNRASGEVPCFDPAWDETCGGAASFQTGTLIINELP